MSADTNEPRGRDSLRQIPNEPLARFSSGTKIFQIEQRDFPHDAPLVKDLIEIDE